MKQAVIHSPDELEDIARVLLETTSNGRVMALYGEIGAGKTALIQALCRRLGVEEEVSSPTFSLVNEYEYKGGEDDSAHPVFHMDLYRLEDIDEALNIGIEEYLYSGAYCFIEWPGLIEALLPEGTIRIKLEIIGDSSRKILIL